MQYPLTQPGVDLYGGKFTDGNAVGGIPASRDRAVDMNLLYDEMIAIVVAAGFTPTEGISTQVRDAILSLVKGGDYKDSVRVASTAAINIAAPGANIDGVAMVAGDRFLEKDNATAANRGIYIWNGPAVPATRALDADTGAELNGGAIIPVESGTVNADTNWQVTNDGAVTIGTTGLTFQQIGAAQAQSSNRNRIINGAFDIDQRNLGASQSIVAAAALAYTVDRWYGYCTGANVTGQQVTGPSGYRKGYQFTGAAANTAVGFGQRIESVNVADLASSQATLSATLSSSSLTSLTWTAYYANTADTFGTLASPTRTQIATGTFTINNTPTRYNTQITLPANAANGVEIVFSSGALLAAQTLNISGVQLESGSSATSFEKKQYGQEMSLSQRYFQNFGNGAFQTAGTSTTGVRLGGLWPMQFRVAPTVTTGAGHNTSPALDQYGWTALPGGAGTVNLTTGSAEL